MPEYIRKEQALRIAYTAFEGTNYMEDAWAYCTQKLRALPAADVVEVVHAHWIEDEYAYARCDHCGYEMDYPEYITPYCPHCGSKMEDDDE